jgi:proteasome lid subunit RPN8/RPN11
MSLAEALPALLPALAALAEADPDREICGFVLRSEDGRHVLSPARNAAPEPAGRFEVDVRDLLALHKRTRAEGSAIAAVYHSHPRGGAGLSALDREASLLEDGAPLLPGVELLVVGLGGGKAEEVRLHRWCEPGIFVEVARAARRRTSGEAGAWAISGKLA